jgi:tungstate transport system substrate-binding protein
MPSRPPIRWRLWICITLATQLSCAGEGTPPRLVLGATHTLEDSGLLDVLSTGFREAHGSEHRLSVIVAGSGEILAMAGRGDVDAVLSHSPAAEIALVASGAAGPRRSVMHNDFILLGPPSDPARASTATSTVAALRAIAADEHPFVSRGDDSGTHHREQTLLVHAGVTAHWRGYVEAGTGMADALRLASQRRAYILSDRATFEMLRDQLELVIVQEGGADMLNEYSVLRVTGAHNADGAQVLERWLLGEAQGLIARYRSPRGRVLFTPGEPR